MSELLYGHNPAPGLVAAHQLSDSQIRVFRRETTQNGKTSYEDMDFFPFLFLSEASLLEGFDRKHWLKELQGTNYYRYLVVVTRWTDMWQAVRHTIDRYREKTREAISGYLDAPFLHIRPDPVSQYLLQSGSTLFKGMLFEDLRRMQVSILAHASGSTPDPRKTEDRITAIAISDSSGWEEILDGRKMDEPTLLRELLGRVGDRDPDVLEGHNLFGHVLPYLAQRFALHEIPCTMGREGTELKHIPGKWAGVESDPDAGGFDLPGRHLLDTQLLAETYDFSKRTLDALDLASLARLFTGPDTPPGPGTKSADVGKAKGATASILQDCRDIRIVAENLLPANFYLTQIVPLSFGTLARTGSAAKIESLMVREYLRTKSSLPRPEQGTQTTGGYSDIFMTGVFDTVVHADVESLYPSIILNRGIRPRTDELGIFDKLLETLVSMRLEAKQSMNKSTDPATRERFDAIQSSYKILINSFYGYLGYTRGLFNDYAKADEITKAGQALLRKIVRQISLFNGRVLEADTDGVFFVPPDNVVGEAHEAALVERISDSLPSGIRLVMAGRFRKMMSYKKKNYALLGQDGSLLIRGSSLVSRSMERYLRRFLRLAIANLLDNNIEGLHSLYGTFHADIVNHRWDAADFCRTETIHDPFPVYEREIGERKRNPAAAYEVARLAGRIVRPGDRVSYYVTGTTAGVKISENCRLAEEWDPNFPDENTAYYLSRLEEAAAKFDVFFSTEDFRKIFTVDDLFGFDARGITILQRQVAPETEEGSTRQPDDSEFRIWLGEA